MWLDLPDEWGGGGGAKTSKRLYSGLDSHRGRRRVKSSLLCSVGSKEGDRGQHGVTRVRTHTRACVCARTHDHQSQTCVWALWLPCEAAGEDF